MAVWHNLLITACAAAEGSVKDNFGVKQGAVLSPVLFCAYTDELFPNGS